MAIGITLALSVIGTAAKAESDAANNHGAVSSARTGTAEAALVAGEPKAAQLPPQDQYIGQMQVVGKREIGSAAWYGGPLIGRRTASGDRLDAVHATAAHRSLPLATLVRVTNLTNGRSVIAKITDRGPVSHSLLIDVSPAVADKLDMRRAGIAKVSVEPVAPVARVASAVR